MKRLNGLDNYKREKARLQARDGVKMSADAEYELEDMGHLTWYAGPDPGRDPKPPPLGGSAPDNWSGFAT